MFGGLARLTVHRHTDAAGRIALILRAVKKTGAYHALIAASQVTWFIAYVSFLLGMYKFS